MGAALDRLRPHPHRGDVIAAGAVPLALAAVVIELRMTQWALGPRFAVVALISLLLVTMGLLAPLESTAPRPYHSVLFVSGLLPLVIALVLLSELLGASRPPGSGGEFWTFALEAGVAAVIARRFNSAVCTLIAALAAAVSLEAFVNWVFQPQGIGTFRAFLVVLALTFAVCALRVRDSRRRHAVAFVDAAGLVTLVLALTFLIGAVAAVAMHASGNFLSVDYGVGAAFGWKLYLLAAGFGLIAYAGVDREAGPAYIGVAILVAFAVLVGVNLAGRGSLVGWPLFLLLIGAAGLAIGLRPRQPLPPPPGETAVAPTVPLHPQPGTERLAEQPGPLPTEDR
jgi:hypothetical protein